MSSAYDSVAQSIERSALERLVGRLPETELPDNMPNPVELGRLREDAYNNSGQAEIQNQVLWRERVAAWTANTALRGEVVLRLKFLNDPTITPISLEIREFLEPEHSDEEHTARLADDRSAVVGLNTLFTTNTTMEQLIVERSLLTISRFSKRGRTTYLSRGQYSEQPRREAIKVPLVFSFFDATDRHFSRLESGAAGNLLAPSAKDVELFMSEFKRGAKGKHGIPAPQRDKVL